VQIAAVLGSCPVRCTVAGTVGSLVGTCCARDRPKRRLRKEGGYKEFLDKAALRVPVATAHQFVGRRRQAQEILRAFRDPQHAGVLLWGMGSLGKSSLAARIANRLPSHQTRVVFEHYDASAIFRQLLGALPPEQRQVWRAIGGH